MHWRPPWRPAAPRWMRLHLGVDLQRRDPCRYVWGVLVHHRLEAVVGRHRGQRGVVGRGDGAVHGRCGAVVGQLQIHAVQGALPRPPARRRPTVCLLLERAVVSELCSAAMLLPCAATCPSVVARAAAVARGAITGASALLSSFEANPVVQGLDGGCVVAGGCRVHHQICYLRVGRQSQGQLPCSDVRAVSYLSVVQDLRDVDRSFKHVYICFRRRLSHYWTKASAKELRKARPAPRLRSWSPRQARIRPAPGPHQARARVFRKYRECDTMI